MKLTRLAADDFVTLAARTEMGADACAMARSVLVDNRSLPDVAAEHEVTKQRVHLAVETIRKEYGRSGQENGWLSLQLELPHSLAHDLDRFVAALSKQSDAGMRHATLVKLARGLASAEHSLEQ